MKAEEDPTQGREDQIHPRITTSTALKYIPRRKLNQRGLNLCFWAFGACWYQEPELPPDSTKEMWTFFRGFFALPDRGRVWIVGTQGSK